MWVGLLDPETLIYCALGTEEEQLGYVNAICEASGQDSYLAGRPRFSVGQHLRIAEAFLVWFEKMDSLAWPEKLTGRLEYARRSVIVRSVVQPLWLARTMLPDGLPERLAMPGIARYELDGAPGVWPEEVLRPAD